MEANPSPSIEPRDPHILKKILLLASLYWERRNYKEAEPLYAYAGEIAREALESSKNTKQVRSFTLYPPGYAPYRRQPVLDQAPDGSEPLRASSDPLEAFEGTLFEAALDARNKKAWARDSGRDLPDRWYQSFRGWLYGLGHV